MVRKNYARKNNYRKKNNKSKKTSLTKSQKKEVKKIISVEQKKETELKYLINSTFVDNVGHYLPKINYNSSTGVWSGDRLDRMVLNVSPSIVRGTSSNNMIGNQVSLKALDMFIRFRPDQYSIVNDIPVAASSMDIMTKSPVPNYPDVKIHIFRMDKDAYDHLQGDLSAMASFAYKLDAVYRPRGTWKQDYLQSGGQEFIKSIKHLKTKVLKQKYSQYRYTTTRGNITSGTSTLSVDDYNNSYNTTLDDCWFQWGAVGLQSDCHIHVKIDDVVEIEAGSGGRGPIRYQYVLFAQFSDKYQDVSGWMEPSIPLVFDTRNMWTYTDC